MSEKDIVVVVAPSQQITTSSMDINGKDVVRLVLQYLKESGLPRSARILQEEAGVKLNSIDDPDALAADIRAGRWDAVLEQVTALEIPPALLGDLYEQIVVELLELRELETARVILRQATPLRVMAETQPQRFRSLERLAASPAFNPRDYYAALYTTREKRRAQIAARLAQLIPASRPSRLLELLGHALRWEQHEHDSLLGGATPAPAPAPAPALPSGHVSLLTGKWARSQAELDAMAENFREDYEDDPFSDEDADENDGKENKNEGPRVATELQRTINLGDESHFECARFSPNGARLVTGSADGFAEVWDQRTARLDKSLPFQAREELMLHDTAILCCAFSPDSESLVTGSQDGCIKTWSIASGRCLRKVEHAHDAGITCLAFGAAAGDPAQIYSGSFDATIRVHGLRSGRVLREFRGHTGYVNDIAFVKNGLWLVSAASDSTVRIWDTHSADCIASFDPTVAATAASLAAAPSALALAGPAVLSAQPLPHDQETLLVCTRSAAAYLVSLRGDVKRAFRGSLSSPSQGQKKFLGETGAHQAAAMSNEASEMSSHEFVACALDNAGKWLYCGCENGTVFVFNAQTGSVERSFEAHKDGGLIGLAYHPRKRMLITWAEDGTLKMWSSKLNVRK